MTMSTAQNPYKMAYLAVETMVKHLNGEQVDPVVDSGYTIITKDNAQEQAVVAEPFDGRFPFLPCLKVRTERLFPGTGKSKKHRVSTSFASLKITSQ